MTNQDDSAFPKSDFKNFSFAKDFSEPKTRTVSNVFKWRRNICQHLLDNSFHIDSNEIKKNQLLHLSLWTKKRTKAKTTKNHFEAKMRTL